MQDLKFVFGLKKNEVQCSDALGPYILTLHVDNDLNLILLISLDNLWQAKLYLSFPLTIFFFSLSLSLSLSLNFILLLLLSPLLSLPIYGSKIGDGNFFIQ
jgi:hypothetical protein